METRFFCFSYLSNRFSSLVVFFVVVTCFNLDIVRQQVRKSVSSNVLEARTGDGVPNVGSQEKFYHRWGCALTHTEYFVIWSSVTIKYRHSSGPHQ